MALGHGSPQGRSQFSGGFIIRRQPADGYAVGDQGLQAAIGQPRNAVAPPIKKLEHGVFVIAHKEDEPETRPVEIEQCVDYLRAFWTAIYVVTEENELAVPVRRMSCCIGRDVRQQFI